MNPNLVQSLINDIVERYGPIAETEQDTYEKWHDINYSDELLIRITHLIDLERSSYVRIEYGNPKILKQLGVME
jgi:hypothetical protein